MRKCSYCPHLQMKKTQKHLALARVASWLVSLGLESRDQSLLSVTPRSAFVKLGRTYNFQFQSLSKRASICFSLFSPRGHFC